MTEPTIQDTAETRAKIEKVGYALLGSCSSADEQVAEEFGEDVSTVDLPQRLLQHLDEIAYCCDQCGWWVEPGETDENGHCESCAEDNEED